MALSQNTPAKLDIGDFEEFNIVGSGCVIYEGAAVGLITGTKLARPLNARDQFAGHAQFKVDNTLGVSTKRVQTRRKFYQQQVSVPSVAVTSIDGAVYMSDDGTYTLTETATTTLVGKVVRYVSSGVAIVEFEPLISNL